MLAQVWGRFVSDLRDLWTLITKGPPADDPIMFYRLAADMAKIPDPSEDIDAWEGRMYSLSNKAFWFAFDRYRGTPYDYPGNNRRYRTMDEARALAGGFEI